jgi:hypothetical protein
VLEPLTAAQCDVGTPNCARVEWDAPHRIGATWRDPQDPSGGNGIPPRSIGKRCRNPSPRPNEMARLLTAPEWNGTLLIASGGNATNSHRLGRERDARRASEWNVGAAHCVPMRCQNSSPRPNAMGCSSSHRKGSRTPSPPRRKLDAPQGIRVNCRDRPLGPNEMSEPLSAPERNGMVIVASDGNVATLTRSARNWDATQSIGVWCCHRPLRPNEMSELLTAPEWNGMLLIASEGDAATHHPLWGKWDAPRSTGMKCRNPHCVPMRCQNFSLRPNGMDAPHGIGGKCHNPHPPRMKWDATQIIGVKCRNPSLRPNEMSELLTAPEWNGMPLIASQEMSQPITGYGEDGTPLRASE